MNLHGRQSARRRNFGPAVEQLDQIALLSGTTATVAPHLISNFSQSTTQEFASRVQSTIKGIVYTHHGSNTVKLDLYLPTGQAPAGGWPIILAFPGGGWRQASRKDYGGAVSVFTQKGYAVAGVDYTYAPKSGGSTWPTILDDARAAVDWVGKNDQKYHLNADKIIAMGESSGAHLALLLGTFPNAPAPAIQDPAPTSTDVTPPSKRHISAIVDFYGPVNLPELYSQTRAKVLPYFRGFLGGTPTQLPDRYKDASPIKHVDALTPPTLIVQGLKDPTVLPSQSLELNDKLAEVGVRHTLFTVPWAGHGFRLTLGKYSFVPDIVAFLDGALNGGNIPDSKVIGDTPATSKTS
jgi:acetyl esterase/lipase